MPRRFVFFHFFALMSVMAFVGIIEPATAGEIDFEGQVSFHSDYIFRGVSRTNKGISGQLNLDLVHDKGLYAGAFFTNFKDSFGHDAEIEFYVGYSKQLGAYDVRLAAAFDSFHGGNDSKGFFEIRSSIARDFGLIYLSAGLNVAPSNREFGTGRSVYVYSEAELPLPFPALPPMSLDFKVGYEDFSGGFNKWDWSVGLFVDIWDLEWSLQYHDTNLGNIPNASANVLFSLRKYF